MPGDVKELKNSIDDKLKYIDLDLSNIPTNLNQEKKINYKILKEFDDATYKVYKYISVDEIEIFICKAPRLASLKEKYKSATHISKYFEDKKQSELLEALSNTNIEEIQEIEQEQKILNEKMPYSIKYKNGYKWQIYYSENDNKYFMLVPLSEKDNAALFYLIKEKISCLKNNIDKKIYVPICHEEYSEELLNKKQIADIENYLWFFTKKWPAVYEVYDKENNLEIQIVGKTNIYRGVESDYKLILNNKSEADEKYKLMKALFIIGSDLKYLYKFESNIDDDGLLKFSFDEQEIEFKDMEAFIKEQVNKQIDTTKELIEKNKEFEEKINNLKDDCEKKNQEYSSKEKQIVMFLQCKKTFIGRFKYFFKSKKSKKKMNIKRLDDIPKIIEFAENEENEGEFNFEIKDRYTIEDLLTICHILEKKDTIYNNKILEIKSLEEKIKILDKKIENADLYIQEIEEHKRSIFEFWKFTNKDVPNALTEAEKLEQEQKNKAKKVFNYQEDLKDFGRKMDALQKKLLSKNEVDALYVMKDYVDIINIFCKKEIEEEDNLYISTVLKQEKLKNEKESKEREVIYFDIFGNIDKKPEEIKKEEDKKERKDKYQILHLGEKTTVKEFKENISKFKKILEKEYDKITIPYDISLYSILNQNTMSDWCIANINPDNIIKKEATEKSMDIIKYNLPEGSPLLLYTNCIMYKGNNIEEGIEDNSETLLYLSRFDRELTGKLKRKISFAKNEYENVIKTIKIYEYRLKPKEENDDK